MSGKHIGKGAALIGAIVVLAAGLAGAQTQTPPRYQQPPQPIAQILDTPPTPAVSLSRDRRTMAVLGRENLPPINDLAQPILRLAGYRINPVNNGPSESRIAWLNTLAFQDVESGARREVALPRGMRFTYVTWSPDGSTVAFVAEGQGGLELWVADKAGGAPRRLVGPRLNAAFGLPFRWTPDSATLITYVVPEGRGAAPTETTAPSGPLVQENIGRTAPVRTFQDLLQNPHDEALFDHYFTAQLVRVNVASGAMSPLADRGLYLTSSVSPDGRYLLVTRVKRPFSTAVTASQFPLEIYVMDMNGRVVHRVVDRPVADNLPPAFNSVVTGAREATWRADAPATLMWAETQDGGNPATAAPVRDRLFLLDAPFRGRPRVLAELADRYAGVTWGRDDYAIVYSRWFNTRNEKRFAVNPSSPGAARLILERNYQDRYNDPGAAVVRPDARGQFVIHFTADGQSYFASGQGATRQGEFPFLDRVADRGRAERTALARAGAALRDVGFAAGRCWRKAAHAPRKCE